MTDSKIHHGHRGRMRRKLLDNGARTFDTYELLEMLLYHVIPYKDTNPVSKKLLSHFGSLDGVFKAKRNELLCVDGVGYAVADFLVTVGGLMSVDKSETDAASKLCFDSNKKIGRFFVEYFTKLPKGSQVVMLALDNRMHFIGVKVICDAEYDTAAIHDKPFVDYALSTRASVAIVAHSHCYGPRFPSPGDIQTNRFLQKALMGLGVNLVESYVISGYSYTPSMSNERFMIFRTPELERFVKSVESQAVYNEQFELALYNVMRYAVSDPGAAIKNISARYRNFPALITADINDLAHIESVGASGANLLCLFSALNSRKETDKFKFGCKHSEAEITDYLKALFMPMANETLYALLLDAARRVISSEYLGEGTVNSTTVVPRKILEVAVRKNASSIIIAHNHPMGFASPSAADLSTTEQIRELLQTMRIGLEAHYVVAYDEYTKI